MGERRDALKHTACASMPGTEVSMPRDGANAAERPVLLSLQAYCHSWGIPWQ
jgi:hypothetical protein